MGRLHVCRNAEKILNEFKDKVWRLFCILFLYAS